MQNMYMIGSTNNVGRMGDIYILFFGTNTFWSVEVC